MVYLLYMSDEYILPYLCYSSTILFSILDCFWGAVEVIQINQKG